ncbi:MAG: hypothetical protein INR71_00555 [Terriglobus roseus]|nr:hypothetical protein [Terriglobus roseus]
MEGVEIAMAHLLETSNLKVVDLLQLANAPNLFQVAQGRDTIPSRHSAFEIYDAMVSTWMSELPEGTPIAHRKLLSDVTSQLASEVSLSSVVIHQPFPETSTEVGNRDTPKARERAFSPIENELRRGGPSPVNVSLQGFHSPASGGPRLPITPEPTPSVISGSSYERDPEITQEGAFERLRRLVDFDMVSQSHVPRMNRVLRHWDAGADPNSYSWTEARGRFESDGEKRISRRAERRARRYMERQQKEFDRSAKADSSQSQAASLAVAQSLPVRTVAASQIPSPMGMQSSQSRNVAGPSFSQSQNLSPVVASQVERGPFGGRTRLPAKKKPRRAGF